MLTTGKEVLLLTKDEKLIERYSEIAGVCGFRLEVQREWSSAYRISHDVIVADVDFIQCVSELYRDRVVALFSGAPGDMFRLADRFIFNRESVAELMYSVMRITTDLKVRSGRSVIMQRAGSSEFKHGDYDFDFASNRFSYRGEPIHLSEGQATALANWLLLGMRDNNCSVQLYNLRKTLGKQFLKDVNRYGEVMQ